ncbi:MAG: adenylate kinase [Corynebacteriales bacterium]|nr:adenylate kinase [Mycobacteriales bacterium]
MRLVLVGPPGAGKGTQAAFIADHFGIPSISTGDLFRSHVAAGTDLGKEAKRYLSTGELVPDEITINMVAGRLDDRDTVGGFLLDGFPRNVPQAEVLGRLLKDRGLELDVVLELVIEPEEVIRRLSGRRTCRGCGKIWHIEFDPTARPGVCDRCGGELYVRDDDQPETVRHRLEVYTEQTAPLVDYYAATGRLVGIQATGPVEDITARAIDVLEGFTE